MRITIDRRRANFDQGPVDDRRVLGGASDIVEAAEEEYGRADAENYRKRADRRQDAQDQRQRPKLQRQTDQEPSREGKQR